MGNLLFNPNGRIERNRFWQGMVVLTVMTVLIQASSAMVNPFMGLLGFFAIYPYICVYGKRLHDAGTTAWWTIGIWLGALLLGVIIGMILGPFFINPETLVIQQEMLERMQAGDMAGAMEGAKLVSLKTLPLNLISIVVTNSILGAIIGFLATDPRENKHGPVSGMSDSGVFD